jgi:multidrug transporter EmrE-like cation transporter
MEALIKIKQLLYGSKTWKIIFAIALITIFKTGVWIFPNIGASELLAQNPFINPFDDPNAHYLVWNWLGPFLAWLIGAKGKWEFILLHLFYSIGFTYLTIRMILKNSEGDEGRAGLIIFSVLSVASTSYLWIGMDSLTLLLMALALAYPEFMAITFAMGTLLGMQHFEQGFFATSGLLIAIILSRRVNQITFYSVKFCLIWMMGVIFGKIVLFGIFNYHSLAVNSGRVYWLNVHLPILLNQFFFHFHYILWSILGVGWFVAIRFADLKRNSIPFFIALALMMLLIPVSGDQTRVLAIITFPLICNYWLLNSSFLKSISKNEIASLFVIWALMPLAWVWGGTPKWSAFPYDIAFILNKILGWFSIPGRIEMWPFN